MMQEQNYEDYSVSVPNWLMNGCKYTFPHSKQQLLGWVLANADFRKMLVESSVLLHIEKFAK